VAPTPKVSPVLAILDRMMAAPAPAAKVPEPEAPRNPHAGAASAGETRPEAPVKDALDEAAELFKTVFKGDIIP